MAIRTFENLYKPVSRFLGTGDTPTGDDLSRAKDLVNRGYRRALGEHEWSFMQAIGTLTTINGKYSYWLPDDFERMFAGVIAFDLNDVYPDIIERSWQQLQSKRAEISETTTPRYFAIDSGIYSKTAGTRYSVSLYPTPEIAYILHYPYIFDPPEMADADDRIVGTGDFSNAVLACSLAEAETTEDEKIGPQEVKAQRVLATTIQKDITKVPSFLGYNGAAGTIRERDRDIHLIQNGVDAPLGP